MEINLNSFILSRISNYPNALAAKFEQYKSYFCLIDPCFLRLMMTVLGPTFLNPDYILLSFFVCGASFETSTIDIFSFPIKIILYIYYCPSLLFPPLRDPVGIHNDISFGCLNKILSRMFDD